LNMFWTVFPSIKYAVSTQAVSRTPCTSNQNKSAFTVIQSLTLLHD